MTPEETTKLAKALADGRLRELYGAFPDTDNALGDPVILRFTPDEIELVNLTLELVLDLKVALGGDAAPVQELELVLDPIGVADAVGVRLTAAVEGEPGHG